MRMAYERVPITVSRCAGTVPPLSLDSRTPRNIHTALSLLTAVDVPTEKKSSDIRAFSQCSRKAARLRAALRRELTRPLFSSLLSSLLLSSLLFSSFSVSLWGDLSLPQLVVGRRST